MQVSKNKKNNFFLTYDLQAASQLTDYSHGNRVRIGVKLDFGVGNTSLSQKR